MPKNPSPAQTAASRRNGAKSKGPVSPEGRTAALAHLDRTAHALLAKTLVLPGESEDRFAELHHRLWLDHRPQSTAEALIVEHMAAAAWRIRRAQAYEKWFLSQSDNPGLDASAHTFKKAPLRRTLKYETAWFNQFSKSHRDLLRLQVLRRSWPAEPGLETVSTQAEPLPSDPPNQSLDDLHPSPEPENSNFRLEPEKGTEKQ